MKSLKFLKPALATALAIVIAWLLSGGRAQAGYTVTLQEVGPDVVASGSGALNLTGLTPVGGYLTTQGSVITSSLRAIVTGPTSGPVDTYQGGDLGQLG